MPEFSINSDSPETTRLWGKTLAKYLRPGDCIPLIGNIGSGKTCFVQGIAQGLGLIDGYAVTSPSFTLINRYPTSLPLVHVDLYRLGPHADLDDLELSEILNDGSVVFIEWPELALPELLNRVITIQFHWDMKRSNTRLIQFQTKCNRFNTYFQEIKSC